MFGRTEQATTENRKGGGMPKTGAKPRSAKRGGMKRTVHVGAPALETRSRQILAELVEEAIAEPTDLKLPDPEAGAILPKVAFAAPITLADGTTSKIGMVRRGVRRGEWKFVRTDPYPLLDVAPGSLPAVPDELAEQVVREELFHLGASGDGRDVLRKYPEAAAEMRELLRKYLDAERVRAPSVPPEVDPEMKLRLESLGYGG